MAHKNVHYYYYYYNLCLFCLSLVDGMLVISSSLISSDHCLAHLFRPDLETWWKWSVHSYALGLVRGSLLCSGCVTMIISVERCVCVFLPLRATSLIRTRTMAVLLFTTVATTQGLCLVYPLKVQALVLLLEFRSVCCDIFSPLPLSMIKAVRIAMILSPII